MSFTLTTGGQGTVATAEVVWSYNGQTYKFRSDNNFLSWITSIFTIGDVLSTAQFVAEATTVGTTPQNLLLAGSGGSILIPNDTLLSGICTISGIKTDGSQVGVYQRSIAIKNIGGSMTLVHVSTISTDHEDDATWGVTINATNTPPSLVIECVGGTGDTVKWKAVFRGLQIAIA